MMRNRYSTANKNVYFLLPVFIFTEQVNAISIFWETKQIDVACLFNRYRSIGESRNKTE